MALEFTILLSQFLEMMSTERRVTRSTLSAYETDLLNFYRFLQNQAIESVTSKDIQQYLLTQKHLSPPTVERRLSSLRQFYIFLMSLGKVAENPFVLVKTSYNKPKPTPFLTEEEVNRLVSGAKIWGGVEGKRLFVLLQILCVANISVNTLVSLPLTVGLEVLKNEKPFLVLQEEGKKNQIVSLNPIIFESFQDYMRARTFFLRNNEESLWLFPSLSQKGHLTRQRFGQLVKELSLKVGLDTAHHSLTIICQGLYNINQN